MDSSTELPQRPTIDFAELLARVDNDRELLIDLMGIFKEDFPRHMKELVEVAAARDLKKAAVVSHTLKGMLANLAVTHAAAAAAKLEQLARDGADAAIAEALVAFEREVHGLLPEMEAYMSEVRR
jgi:HPt (histidine-containing phosphotransfer) domain-containing protein